jgi:hypothetical protein
MYQIDEDLDSVNISGYFPSPLDTKLKKSGNPDDQTLPFLYIICFWAVSFAYMCAWTSFGSLISYYKHQYGSEFYTKIYIAYYLPGLPVCLLQYKFDTYHDIKYGSHQTFLVRGMFCISTMVFIIMAMILLNQQFLLVLCFGLLGALSWAAHGTASTLAALYVFILFYYCSSFFSCL